MPTPSAAPNTNSTKKGKKKRLLAAAMVPEHQNNEKYGGNQEVHKARDDATRCYNEPREVNLRNQVGIR